MKALTLTQPWATLVSIGAKKVETRSWRTSYRGPLAIHASKGFPKYAKDACHGEYFLKALLPLQIFTDQLPRGAVLATCSLVDIIPTDIIFTFSDLFQRYRDLDTPQERAFGNYSTGRYAWIMEDAKALTYPVPSKGALSLWNWDEKGHL